MRRKNKMIVVVDESNIFAEGNIRTEFGKIGAGMTNYAVGLMELFEEFKNRDLK